MIPIVKNICYRCNSDRVEAQPNGIFICRECGKADKSHLMKLQFSFPTEGGDPEIIICRHMAREMAGFMSENVATAVAVGLSRSVESYQAKLPPPAAKAILSKAVGACFDTMYNLLIPYLPNETKEEIAKANAAITRANTLMEAEREKARKEAEHAGGTGEGSPGGDAEGEPPAGVVQDGVAGADLQPPQGDLGEPAASAGAGSGEGGGVAPPA